MVIGCQTCVFFPFLRQRILLVFIVFNLYLSVIKLAQQEGKTKMTRRTMQKHKRNITKAKTQDLRN